MASPYEARGGDCLADDEGDRRVLLVGLACLDIVNEVTAYPAEDSDTRVQEQLWSRGGNASNTSVVLSQLGVRVEYMGTLARHFLSNTLTEDFEKYGVDYGRCVYFENCKTPVSCVITSTSTGTRTIMHKNRTLPELKCEDFDSINFEDFKWIHFEGRNIPEVIKMIDVVDEYNRGLGDSSLPPIHISVEIEKPKWKAYVNDLLPKADLIFLSKDIARAFDCSSGEECVLKFFSSTKPGAMIVCAWGEQGAWAIEGNGNVVRSGAYPPPRVVDTLGAGDTFNAGVIASLSRGDDLLQAITQGCKLAGRKIGRHGFDIVSDALSCDR